MTQSDQAIQWSTAEHTLQRRVIALEEARKKAVLNVSKSMQKIVDEQQISAF